MVVQEGAAKSPFRAFRARDAILLRGELRSPFLIGLHDARDELGLGQAAFAVIKGDEHFIRSALIGGFFFHGLSGGFGGRDAEGHEPAGDEGEEGGFHDFS